MIYISFDTTHPSEDKFDIQHIGNSLKFDLPKKYRKGKKPHNIYVCIEPRHSFETYLALNFAGRLIPSSRNTRNGYSLDTSYDSDKDMRSTMLGTPQFLDYIDDNLEKLKSKKNKKKVLKNTLLERRLISNSARRIDPIQSTKKLKNRFKKICNRDRKISYIDQNKTISQFYPDYCNKRNQIMSKMRKSRKDSVLKNKINRYI